jgi:hypothetical protein
MEDPEKIKNELKKFKTVLDSYSKEFDKNSIEEREDLKFCNDLIIQSDEILNFLDFNSFPPREKYKIFQITFYEHPLEYGASLTVYPEKNPDEIKYDALSTLPNGWFGSWDIIKTEGGMEEWGDLGILSIIKGNANSSNITVKLEGRVGNGVDQNNTTFYPVLRCVSKPVLVKVVDRKNKWEHAIWDYTLQTGETIHKIVTQSWSGKFGKLYRKYNNSID